MEMTKDQVQKKVLGDIKEHHRFILFEWCTGLGKSFAALNVVERFAPKEVLLLVAEEAHKKNWMDEMFKYHNVHGYNIPLHSKFIIECYASLKNYNDTNWDMVIMDECHHLSDARADVMSTIDSSRIVALSATLEQDIKDRIFDTFNLSSREILHSRIPLQEAISMGLMPEPDIYVIPVLLNDYRMDQTIIETRGSAKKRKVVHCEGMQEAWKYKKDKANYPDLELHIKCTQEEKNKYYDDNVEYYKRLTFNTGQPHLKNKWMKLGIERKRFLGECKSQKLDMLIQLLKDKNKRFICFCSSIEQADSVDPQAAIHSKNPLSNKLLQEFQEKKSNHLVCVNMLAEGQNLVDIEIGIIAQLDGKPLPFTQKHGRVLRSDNPTQYIFYCPGTRDEEYLNKVLENLNKDYVHYVRSLKDLII